MPRGKNGANKNTIQVNFFGLLLGAAAVFFIGASLGWLGHEVPPETHAVRESGYEFINPILLCNLDSSVAENEDISLTKKLRDYISQAPSVDVSVYYLKPGGARWAGVNENERFSPASMLKVPIMAAVLRDAETHPELVDQKVYYDGAVDHNALEAIKPVHPLLPGNSYSVQELIRAMIVESDNNATELLTNLLTQKEFENIYTDLGLEVPSVGGPVDFMSTKAFTLFLRVLYNGTYLSRENSQFALKLMSESNFAQGIRAGVPSEVTVASKFGERRVDSPSGVVEELHDCGMVYAEKGPYFLCIMTRGNTLDTLAKEIADLSKIVYEAQ
ncbi:MAG: serine hydrolase [Patescibacteria group bacterium]